MQPSFVLMLLAYVLPNYPANKKACVVCQPILIQKALSVQLQEIVSDEINNELRGTLRLLSYATKYHEALHCQKRGCHTNEVDRQSVWS